MVEAKFHILVDRQPLRESSMAWQRTNMQQIPTELQAWVGDMVTQQGPADAATSIPSADSKQQPVAASSTN
jgi:hypothetical protein